MADWKFIELLKFSYAYQGTILKAITDKHMFYPGSDQLRAVYNEALDILRNYCSEKFSNNKSAMDKLNPLIKSCEQILMMKRHQAIEECFDISQETTEAKFRKIRVLYEAIMSIEKENSQLI